MSVQKPNTVQMLSPIEYAAYQRSMASDLSFTEAKLRRLLTVKDRQQALSRFEWDLDGGELEVNFTPNMLEGMLYDKYVVGAGVVEEGVIDIFTPSWSKSLDRYGRMTAMKPMFPVMVDKEGNVKLQAFNKEFEIVYKDNKKIVNAPDSYGAVCYDYTPSINQTGGEPRVTLQAKVIEEMADLYNFSTINLINSLGIAKYNILDEGQRDAVELELRGLYGDLKRGKFYQLTTSMQSLQDLTKPIAYNGQSYWQSYNSLNNERLGFLGLVNSGSFNKKERKLLDEVNVESANSDKVLENSLKERQTFCENINHIYGTNFSVRIIAEEVNEDVDISEDESSISDEEQV